MAVIRTELVASFLIACREGGLLRLIRKTWKFCHIVIRFSLS